MKYRKILITGGAGFIGSNLAINLKNDFRKSEIICLDNLIRKGSSLNLPRLEKNGIIFIKGDIRNKKDLDINGIDLMIECSAEPSVMAGITSPPDYLLETNLIGAVNCFELARKERADVIFLSTSRIYPIAYINSINTIEEETRLRIISKQEIPGVSLRGINEKFPLDGARSLYGATKLCAEYLLTEYINSYGIKGIINRCSLVSGPWQMGKIDQGVIMYFLAAHIYNKPLTIYGNKGKQVRDVLNINDLYDLLKNQIENMDKFNNGIYNVGGGSNNNISLTELTKLCQKITNKKVEIIYKNKAREADIKLYISDNSKIINKTGWNPKISVAKTLEMMYLWIMENKNNLQNIIN